MNDLQILVTMILGALLILVAIWLIAVRRDPTHDKVRIFNVELDLSTPGLAVLAAGCGLLLLPAFVPYRPGGLPGWPGGPTPGVDGRPPVLQQVTVLDREQEPNDTVGSANRITLGQTIEGTLVAAEDPADYFALAVTPETRGSKRVIVRTRGPAFMPGRATLTVWNEKEEQIGEDSTSIGATISQLVRPADAYVLRVSLQTWSMESRDAVVNYELVVIQEP